MAIGLSPRSVDGVLLGINFCEEILPLGGPGIGLLELHDAIPGFGRIGFGSSSGKGPQFGPRWEFGEISAPFLLEIFDCGLSRGPVEVGLRFEKVAETIEGVFGVDRFDFGEAIFIAGDDGEIEFLGLSAFQRRGK